MNCEWVKANITLYLYNELADDARYELEQHAHRCAACAAELDKMGEFKAAMAALPALEPSPNLLAAARLRLQEALETAEQRGWQRWFFDPVAWLRQAKFAPALAAIIFIIGFTSGIGTAYRVVTARNVNTAAIARQAP